MSFTKYHLKLEKDNFKSSALLPIVEEPYTYMRFWDLLQKVGEPSNWPERSIFKDDTSLKTLKTNLSNESSHLWLFMNEGKEVGFCQVANVTKLSDLFNNASGIAEIYKVGLFPEYVGKGMGKGYVSAVARELFKNHHTIYLNTRDTNVVNSIPFYKKLGFEVIKEEVLPDDLVI